MSDFTRSAILFVQEHQQWSTPIIFLLAFCESFAFISLLVPATGILFGVGGLVGAANIQFWPIWFAAASGAIAGDWLAYGVAYHFKDRITELWPFKNRATLVTRGLKFFKRWGVDCRVFGSVFWTSSRNCADRGRNIRNVLACLSTRKRGLGGRLGDWNSNARVFEFSLDGWLAGGFSYLSKQILFSGLVCS